MKTLGLLIAVGFIRLLGLFARSTVKKKYGILLISCQGNEPSPDMIDLASEIEQMPDSPPVGIIAGRMRRGLAGIFFLGKLFQMMRELAVARVVVIDAFCAAVSIPGKIKGLTVIQMWHAPEAIKKFSLQITDTEAGYDSRAAKILCMHRNYDHILCPSDATLPFFEEAFGYPASSFIKSGQPLLDRLGRIKRYRDKEFISPASRTIKEAIYRRYPLLKENDGRKPVVIYAPTFRDDDVPVDAAGLIRALARVDIILVLKLHPLGCLVKLPAEGKTYIADSEFSLINWMNIAEIIVTDYSGVAVDAAVAGIASYYYIYDIDDYKERRGLNVDLREEAVGRYCFKDPGLLAAQVYLDFAEGQRPYDYAALAEFAAKYVEVPLSGNTKRLAEYVAGL